MKKVIVVGGGLAGLVTSIRLARAKIPCLVVEKSRYPFHRVCGEYISNECLNFLETERLFPTHLDIPTISQFQLTSTTGKSATLPLDLGGFGVSRYVFDNFLFTIAQNEGVEFRLDTEVTSIQHSADIFRVTTNKDSIDCDIVVGSFGKRSKLDVSGQRKFTRERSPYVAIKYHIKTRHPNNLIALHNFDGGYCGISNVENGISNLCYLVHRDVLRKHKSISAMESKVLQKNPHLRAIFSGSEFLFDAPETINEVSFETKEPVWNGILMAGDAAGMIAPLCGNGMAMAIRAGKLLSDLIIDYLSNSRYSFHELQSRYVQTWRDHFARRLWLGRIIQNRLFGTAWSSRLAVQIALNSKFIAKQIVKNTHGEPFQ